MIKVVGTVASALARLPAARPEVAILDVRLPDGDGISACRAIGSMLPGVACLMFTAFQDDQALLGAVMAGAAGYVLKGAPVQDVVEAVRVLASSLLMKLGLQRRSQAAVLAVRPAGPDRA